MPDTPLSTAQNLSAYAREHSNYFPVDREVAIQFLDKILPLHYPDFISENLNNFNDTYCTTLFCVLPELWMNLNQKNFDQILKSAKGTSAARALLEYFHKFLGLDLFNYWSGIGYSSDAMKTLVSDEFDWLFHYLSVLEEDDIEDFSPDLLGIGFATILKVRNAILNQIEGLKKLDWYDEFLSK